MSIDYYKGCDGPCVNVETQEELQEIIFVLQDQVINNIGKDSPLLVVLEGTMEKLDDLSHRDNITDSIEKWEKIVDSGDRNQ